MGRTIRRRACIGATGGRWDGSGRRPSFEFIHHEGAKGHEGFFDKLNSFKTFSPWISIKRLRALISGTYENEIDMRSLQHKIKKDF